MKIRYNLDKIQYDKKPTPEEVKKIRTRLCSATSIVETKPEELFEAIEHGQSFTPAVMTGTKSDNWQSQQIIVADIDNDKPDKSLIDKPLQPSDALMLMSFHNIEPFAMYYSFSNRDDHPKYRIVLILDKPITDKSEAKELTSRLTAIFNDYTAPDKCADTTMSDNARLIFGARHDSVFEYPKTVTPLEVLRELPTAHTFTTATSTPIDNYPTSYNSHFNLLEPLNCIPASSLTYIEWINVGMALKHEGYTADVWDAWSRSDARYKEGECFSKWKTFTGNAITGATITALAKQYGYIPPKDRPKTERTTVTTATSAPIASKVSPTATPEPTDNVAQTATPEPVEHILKDEKDPTPSAIFDEFLNEIKSERFKPIPTGIEQLDNALHGGLERRTLITLASAPGAGKTAIAQYIFENIARNGQPVVYVNLEMDRSQLFSRSLSRLSYEYARSKAISRPLTADEIKRGYNWKGDDGAIVQYVTGRYKNAILPNCYYITTNPENSGHIDNKMSSIVDKLEQITRELEADGRPAPFVCIDYLQFIDFDLWKRETCPKRPDNADAIKGIMNEFKHFALKHNTVVMVITANNRASNAEGRASQDSGRDSSNIEYSADVMLSLVYTAVEEGWLHRSGQRDKDGNDKPKVIDNEFIFRVIDYAKQMQQQDTRHEDNYPKIAKLLTLKVVKNRSGENRGTAKFIFEGKYYSFDIDHGATNPYWMNDNSAPE